MTIKDVARISGYGVSTVSRALSGHPDISAATKQKIQAVADELGFVPNVNARQLKANCSKTVMIIVKGTFNVFFSSLIENIQVEIDRSGYRVTLHYIHTDLNEVEYAHNLLKLEKPIGIVFLGGNVANFTADFEKLIPLPCILCSTSASSLSYKNLSSVSVDDVDAGRKAIDYLIGCGHTKIGIIGGDIKTFCATGQRYTGCLDSFRANGVEYDRDAFELCAFEFDSAYEAAKKLIKRKPELTAFFAMSDTMAIGTIRAAVDLGLSVPDDISVIGFDGIDFSGFYNPRITTFKQPQENIAAITVRQLNAMINSNAKSDHILLKSEFCEGGSVKKI